MTDEEKEALEIVKGITEDDLLNYWEGPEEPYNAIQIILNLIAKQSKEIEELKEERKSYAEEYIHDNPWLYKQLNEVYILRKESEQKEKKAYIDGTNVADKLCNKMWEDKIKAKIEELKAIADNGANAVRFAMTHEDEIERIQKQKDIGTMVEILQLLLEKE